MKKRKGLLTASALILLAVIAVSLYKYGHMIPGINEIPLFSGSHEHRYRPVLGEKGEIEYWTCAMHPSVRMKEPGSCPICGMDLTPVKKQPTSVPETPSADSVDEKAEPSDTESMASMQNHDHGAHVTMAPVAGTERGESRSEFTVSPRRQQLIGVRTEPVEIRPIEKSIRTVGVVKLDETRIEHIHTKFSGWIDKVFVDYTWQHVSKGEPLFSVYSPDLVSTQEEYLLALRSNDILGDSDFPDISEGAGSLLEATKRRLRLWDVSENQIREIAETGKVKDSIVVYSPVSGHVVEKNAYENMYVEPMTTIYTIADHSNVWVDVDIYENEIPLVSLGEKATMTLASYPGEEFPGRVTFITPHLDNKTRTVKVRLQFPNPDLKLLPEMYGDVSFDIPLGEKLAIPESAVIRTGTKDIVFVDKGNGNMQIRRVELGGKAGGYYEVLKGLERGDMVVTRANFLIDSESKIQAAVAAWEEDTAGSQESGSTNTGEPNDKAEGTQNERPHNH